MLHKTDYGLVYNDDGSLCVTHQKDGAVAVEEGTTNLVANGGFNGDLSGWVTTGSRAVDTQTKVEGSGAALLSGPDLNGDTYVYQDVPLAAGVTYTLSYWVKTERAKQVGTRTDGGPRVRWGNGSIVNFVLPETQDWTYYQHTFTPSSDLSGGSARIEFSLHDTDTNGRMWVDGVQLEAKTFATSFVDGTRPDGILAYPIALKDDYTIACYRKSHTDEDYKHVVKRSDGKVFVDGVEDSEYDVGWIAGRNLLKNSDFSNGLTEWFTSPSGIVSIVDDNDFYKVCKVEASGGNQGIYGRPTTGVLTAGETYTLSAMVKADDEMSIGVAIDGSGLSSGMTKTIGTSWEKVVFTKVSSGNNTNPRIYSNSVGTFYIAWVKVEKGSKATDWTPAPEDLGYDGDVLMLSNHTGHIKDLKILPYIATDKEIKQMYSGGTFDVTNKGIVIADNYSEVGITDGLIGWWPLDGHTDDYSGNNNHGTNNGATITSGIRGSAYEFDGVSDHIYLGYPEELKVGNITLCAWVKSIPKDSYQYIIRSRTYGYSLRIREDNYQFSIYESTANELLPKAPFIDSNWHFVVGTYDGSTASIYIDGELKDQVLGSGTGVIHYGGGGVAIGRDGNSSSGHLEGQISDVRIYNRALSPEEIKILYNTTKPDPVPMQISNNGIVYLAGELKEV